MSNFYHIELDCKIPEGKETEDMASYLDTLLRFPERSLILGRHIFVKTCDRIRSDSIKAVFKREFMDLINVAAVEEIDEVDFVAAVYASKSEVMRHSMNATAETQNMTFAVVPPPPPKAPPEDIPSPLDKFIAISKIRVEFEKAARTYLNTPRANKLLNEATEQAFLNTLLVGRTGTGKTSLAKAMAAEFRRCGIVSDKAPIVFMSSNETIGQYIGGSNVMLRSKFDEAKNGVLIIDEIGAWPDLPSFGVNLIHDLNAMMGNNKNNPIVLATCYNSQYEALMRVDEGLRARFKQTFTMPTYDTEMLADILLKKIENSRIRCADSRGVFDLTKETLTHAHAGKGANFSNGREVDSLFDTMIKQRAARMEDAKLLERLEAGETVAEEERHKLTALFPSDVPLFDRDSYLYVPRAQDEEKAAGVVRPKVIAFSPPIASASPHKR